MLDVREQGGTPAPLRATGVPGPPEVPEGTGPESAVRPLRRGSATTARCRSSGPLVVTRHGSRCAARSCDLAGRRSGRLLLSILLALPLAGSSPSSRSAPGSGTSRSRGGALAGLPPSPRGLHRPRGGRPRISQSLPDRQGGLFHVVAALSRGTGQLTGKSHTIHRLSPASPQDLPRQARGPGATRARLGTPAGLPQRPGTEVEQPRRGPRPPTRVRRQRAAGRRDDAVPGAPGRSWRDARDGAARRVQLNRAPGSASS